MNFCIAINHQSWTGYYQIGGLMFKSIQERKLFEVNIKHIILVRVSKAKGGEGGWRMGRGSIGGGGGARKTACPYTDYRDHTPSIALLYPANQLLSHSTFILRGVFIVP